MGYTDVLELRRFGNKENPRRAAVSPADVRTGAAQLLAYRVAVLKGPMSTSRAIWLRASPSSDCDWIGRNGIGRPKAPYSISLDVLFRSSAAAGRREPW